MMLWINFVLLFSACSKEEDMIPPEMIPVSMILGKDSTITFSYPVFASSRDTAIASVTVEQNKLSIVPRKRGSVLIDLKDRAGIERAVIEVTIERGYSYYLLDQYIVDVAAADADAGKSIVEELQKDLPLESGAGYGFKTPGSEWAPLYVFPQGETCEKIVGAIMCDSERNAVSLRYNDSTFTYLFHAGANLIKSRTLTSELNEGPLFRAGFVEDFTEKYKIQYPEAGLTRAYRIQLLLRL